MPLKNKIVFSQWDATPTVAETALLNHLDSLGWVVDTYVGSVAAVSWTADIAWLIISSDLAASYTAHPDDAVMSTFTVPIIAMNRYAARVSLAMAVTSSGSTTVTEFTRQTVDARNTLASFTLPSATRHRLEGSSDTVHYSEGELAQIIVEDASGTYPILFWGDHRFDLAPGDVLTLFGNHVGLPEVELTRSIFAAGGNYLANIDPVTLLQRWREPHPANPDNSFVLTVMAVDRDEACVTLIGQNTFSEVGPDGLGIITSYSAGGVERWLDTYAGTLWGIAIDFTNGDIVVVGVPDGAGHGIRKYNRHGQLLWGVTGHPNPRGVAVRPFDGSIYVAGTGGTPVQKYDSSGQLVMTSATTPGFESADIWYGIDVHNDTGKFVVGIFTGFVDPYPGVQMFNADGTLDWADTLTIALSVAFDQNSGDVYAAGSGVLDVRPAVRKYTAAGVTQWDVNTTATVVHIGWDPATSHVLLTANLNPGGEDLWYAIRLNSIGGSVSQWNYDFWPYANVIVGSEYVEHPTRAATTNLTPTSATFEWEPPG